MVERMKEYPDMARTALILLVLATPLALPAATHGEVAAQRIEGVRTIEILPGWKETDGDRMAALRIRLEPGWKTYWRAPGDAGIPPSFDWEGSQNIRGVKIHWPRPTVARSGGMRSVVYEGDVVLPIEITPEDPGKPITLKAKAELGLCKDICIPASVTFNMEISPSASTPEPMIEKALAAQPVSADAAGVRGVSCSAEPISDGLRVTARISMPSAGGEEIAVMEAPDPSIWVSEGETRREGDTLIATVEMVPPENAPFELDRSGVRITVLGKEKAVDIRGCEGS